MAAAAGEVLEASEAPHASDWCQAIIAAVTGDDSSLDIVSTADCNPAASRSGGIFAAASVSGGAPPNIWVQRGCATVLPLTTSQS